MRALHDDGHALADGLRRIREQFHLPDGFPPEVLDAARAAAARPLGERADRTATPFVTLDPATSTDLDQAFHLRRDGDTLLLDYAIADVGHFVDEGGPLDAAAWERGSSQYLPDGKVPLYPGALTDAAASLLPDGDRPAVVLRVSLDPAGQARLIGAERAVVRSTAKLAYDAVTPSGLPAELDEWARRVTAAEDRRGATRIEVPEQQVVVTEHGYQLSFAPRQPSEDLNATLSLAANLAVADALYAAGTGLFRVMAGPDDRAVGRLRHTARGLGLAWAPNEPLAHFSRGLDPADAAQAAMLVAIRRAGGGASYAPYDRATKPWHDAVAATYAHATAPLRRLADRYVLEATLAVANGQTVPAWVSEAFTRLPSVMRAADDLDGQLNRAVIDLAEAVTLRDRVGEQLRAVVTDVDERGVRIQLLDLPVLARTVARRVAPGEEITVEVTSVDVDARRVEFRRVA